MHTVLRWGVLMLRIVKKLLSLSLPAKFPLKNSARRENYDGRAWWISARCPCFKFVSTLSVFVCRFWVNIWKCFSCIKNFPFTSIHLIQFFHYFYNYFNIDIPIWQIDLVSIQGKQELEYRQYFVCTFSWKEIWVISCFSYVTYRDLSATINPSIIEDLEDRKLFLIFVQSKLNRLSQKTMFQP